MPTLRAALAAASERLQHAGIDTAALDARLLLEHTLGITRETMVAEPERALSAQDTAAYDALVARRAAREPVSHIVGMREFWGLPFKVTADVLTPRPDSETLIEAVLDICQDKPGPCRVLDLGTGSGCLLLTVLHALPDAVGVGVDISPQALAVAAKNAETLGLAGRAAFRQGAWCAALAKNPPETYEIVVANPPYIASNAITALMPEVAEYEPFLALDGGADGLACYREIARQLPLHIAKGGAVVLEIGAGQEADVAQVFEAAGFQLQQQRQDLAGITRCLVMTA